jgi:uncharacterized membrane protein YbjE (DUF340 family)
MLTKKDYAKMTLEELVSEQEKMKSQKALTAVLIGFFSGIAVWSATHKGFALPVCLLITAYLIGSSYSQNTKSIQEEINSRNSK